MSVRRAETPRPRADSLESSRTWAAVVGNYIRSNWKRGEIFVLADLYKETPRFQRIHPKNSRIHAKIRQTLQLLRDKGEVGFVDRRGTYRRLM